MAGGGCIPGHVHGAQLPPWLRGFCFGEGHGWGTTARGSPAPMEATRVWGVGLGGCRGMRLGARARVLLQRACAGARVRKGCVCTGARVRGWVRAGWACTWRVCRAGCACARGAVGPVPAAVCSGERAHAQTRAAPSAPPSSPVPPHPRARGLPPPRGTTGAEVLAGPARPRQPAGELRFPAGPAAAGSQWARGLGGGRGI